MHATSTSPHSSAVMQTYSRFPVTLVKGKGSYVWDEKGSRYLDFTSGIAVCNLGHAPETVKAALQSQLDALWHCSNLYHIPPQEELASLLAANSFGDYVFFCNSGAEANEAAIKLARRYAKKVKGNHSGEIISFRQSFHGRTMAALSATGQEKIHDGFEPLLPGFRYLTYNAMESLKEIEASKACAVLLELIQGEGGVIPADRDWVKAIERICRDKGMMLMIDEVQTGIGRTGTLFAYEQYGIVPDVISIAKGLGSGFPIGGIIANSEGAKGFEPGSHGSTFGGNPLAAAAGLATVKTILSGSLLSESSNLASHLVKGLEALKQKYGCIKEIRGLGLLIGIEVEGNAADIVKAALENHVLILTAGPNVVRILPPLTAAEAEADHLLDVLDHVLAKLN